MKLHYSIYDHRSYLKGSNYWKDLSFHADRTRLNDDGELSIGDRINRNGKFYGNIAPSYHMDTGIDLNGYCLILPPSYHLGISGSKFTLMFYGKFDK